jgi:hypothetical protein
MELKVCPSCGHADPERVYPLKGGKYTTQTYTCTHCDATWHHRWAGPKSELKEKFTVLKEDGSPVAAPSFVLVLTDPAARVAARAYAIATCNETLAEHLLTMVRMIEARPNDFPPPGSEGRLNTKVSSEVYQGTAGGVVIIRKPDLEP